MKYTVIIPTMWLHPVLLETMVIKYNKHPLIDEIIIINNNQKKRLDLSFDKVRVIGTGENIFVNPAWNLGVREAQTEAVIIANDDILISDLDDAIMVIDQALKPGVAIFPHKSCFAKYGGPSGVPRTEIGDEPSYGFGTFMAMCRSTFRVIPDELKVWWGDHLQWDHCKPLFLKGIEIQTEMRGTSKTLDLRGFASREQSFYSNYRAMPQTVKPARKVKTAVMVLRSGGDFSARDVLTLARNLDKYADINKICLNDRAKKQWDLIGVRMIPMNNSYPGWWAKMNLFHPDMEQYRPFLYLDLDTAVVGEMNGALSNDKDFVTLSDFYHPGNIGSGLMLIPAKSDKVSKIWSEWARNKENIMKRFRGDQDFINSVVKPDRFFQDITEGISSYKPKTGHLKALPGDVSIVCFHGKPRIWEAAKSVQWVNNYING